MRDITKTLAILLAASVAGCGGAGAQSLLPPGPLAVIAAPAPAEAESVILGARPVSAPAAAQTAAPEEDRSARLIAFEQAASGYRLEGEADTMRLTFALDASAIAGGGDLVVSYKNAVSIMPEASRIAVSVNGVAVGDFAIRSPSDPEAQSFPVSPAFLRVGTNQMELRAIQRHRVDCSMEATYELWTDIDHAASGFRPRSPSTFTSFSQLRGIGRTNQGLTDLRLIVPAGSGSEAVNAALPLLQVMAIALNRDDLVVTLSDTPGTGPGIDLVIATADNPASLRLAPADAPHGLSVFAAQQTDRARVVLRAGSEAELGQALMAAVEGPLRESLNAAVNAGRPGEMRAEDSRSSTLADIGYRAEPFSGRLFRTGFDLVLPVDFYPAEYATIDLALHAASSPGLKPTSQLLVRVNGQIVKSLPIRDTNGEVFAGRRMELPLRAFHPGRNQIEVLAELEAARDDTCVYLERDEAAPRFILLDTTEIRIPALARVARLPELAALAGSAYPYGHNDGMTVSALRADAHTVSAALTLIAKMGFVAGRPVKASLIFGPPETRSPGNALVVASRRALDEYSRLGAQAFVDMPKVIEFAEVWDEADPIATGSIGIEFGASLALTPDPAAMLEAFRQTTSKLREDAGFFSSLETNLSLTFDRFRRWLNYLPAPQAAELRKPGRIATLSQRAAVGSEGVVTWLTANSPTDLSEAAALLADPAIWNALDGETATLDLDNRSVTTVQAEGYFAHDLTDYSPGNLRRITAAWFSDHFRIYVAVVLGLMAVFAIWLGTIVPKAGVRTDQ